MDLNILHLVCELDTARAKRGFRPNPTKMVYASFMSRISIGGGPVSMCLAAQERGGGWNTDNVEFAFASGKMNLSLN